MGEKVRYLALAAVSLVLTVHHHVKPHAPYWFVKQARCIHSHEEHISWRWDSNYHPTYPYWNHYYTGMQFAGSTWRRANELLHSHASPTTGSPRIIIRHAYAIYREDGNSWREWSTDYLCGLS